MSLHPFLSGISACHSQPQSGTLHGQGSEPYWAPTSEWMNGDLMLGLRKKVLHGHQTIVQGVIRQNSIWYFGTGLKRAVPLVFNLLVMQPFNAALFVFMTATLSSLCAGIKSDRTRKMALDQEHDKGEKETLESRTVRRAEAALGHRSAADADSRSC